MFLIEYLAQLNVSFYLEARILKTAMPNGLITSLLHKKRIVRSQEEDHSTLSPWHIDFQGECGKATGGGEVCSSTSVSVAI